MASVSLTGIWMAPASDLSATQNYNAGVNVGGQYSGECDVRAYAGGVYRAITKPGTRQSVPVTVPLATLTQWAAIRTLIKEVILFRDGRGRCFYGIFASINESAVKGVPLMNVSFTVTEVTHSSEV